MGIEPTQAVPATPQHVFEIGSISKQFTVYANLMPAEQGKLRLDAPVGRYLSDLPRLGPTDAEFQKRLLGLPILQKPGRQCSYSNTNYWLLARVIEKISSQTYAQFMHEHIFAPFDMQSTRTALPSQLLMGRAAGYRLVDGRLENRDGIQPNTGRGLGDIVTAVGAMFWNRIQPFLSQVEENYRRRGALQSVTAIGPNGVQDVARPAYRVVYENMTRVMTVEFDEQNRIKALEAEDE